MFNVPENYSLFAQDLEHIDAQLFDIWPSLNGGHLLITGGTGFFGIWLVESLLWAIEKRHLELQITILTRSPELYFSKHPHLKARKNLHTVRGSVSDFAFPMLPVTHIIHAASETHGNDSATWPARHFIAALDGTKRVLDLAAFHRSEAVLLTTSGAVYTPMDPEIGDRFVEAPQGISDYTSEKVVYGQAKRTMEIMTAIGAQTHGYRALVARCFAFVGPYLSLDSNYAIGNFIRDVLNKQDIVVNGDGTAIRSYLYAGDLVIWLLTILVKGRSGYPYNVGGDCAVSIAALAQLVRSFDSDIKIEIRRTAIAGVRPHQYLPDVTRAKTDLGLRVTTGLENAVGRTLEWHRLRRSQI